MIYNWNIIGHEKQLNMLENDISTGNLSHAYFLCGPSHVGKYTVAKKLAHILQCPNNFCGTCPVCVQVRKGSHLDTMEYANNHESIKIEQVREIIGRCSMSGQSNYKIVLLQSVGRMTNDAANCLLKTLEEPPPRTVFIMTASHIREILPTIVSRARVLKFHAFSVKFLTEKLREMFPTSEEETLNNVAQLALGKTGQAIDLMNNPDELAYHLKLYKDVLYLLETQNVVERFRYVEELVEDESRRRDFLNIMLHVLREKMLEESGKNGSGLRTQGAHRAGFQPRCWISSVENAKSLLKQNVNARLVLENLMLMN
jgi:DNA polymerase-3 subunit delta'